ncbi:MAG: methyltransferase domain-containing protein [Burkholderiaceae bacterium]
MPDPQDSTARYSAPISLPEVRRLFARTDRVAESNFLRREIANRMRERLELVKIRPESVLDAGCGEGEDLSELRQSFPSSHLLAIDASWDMLRAGRSRHAALQTSVQRLLTKWLPKRAGSPFNAEAGMVCGDFANLPLAANSVDLIWSNLALHWHPQPDRVFAEWRRVLKVDGLLMFSCFGPDTLKELRTAFGRIGSDARILPFVDMHDLGDMLVHAGFSTPVMDMETITVTYDQVDKLLGDARALGGNPLATKSRGLFGKQAWNHVKADIEGRRSGGKLPLTFEIVYGHAFRPVLRKTAGGESIVRLDFPKK